MPLKSPQAVIQDSSPSVAVFVGPYAHVTCAAGQYECGLSPATQLCFTTSRGLFDSENPMTKLPMTVLILAMTSIASGHGAPLPDTPAANPPLTVAQSMMPPTGTDDAMH